MKTLLVTGGCGFIASNFVRYCIQNYPDLHIVNLDNLSYSGNRENLKEFEGKPFYEWIRGDISDPVSVSKAMSRADAVVHFAAETHVDRSIDNPSAFLVTNILGTQTMLEEARKAKINNYVHISTDEVYGSLRTGAATEEHPYAPNSPYAASKAAADLLVRSYQKTYGFQAKIVRSSNNFGPFQFPEKVIPLFVTNIVEGKKVPLYGDGSNMRDWLYVEDNCRGIDLVLRKGGSGEIYNIGVGNEKTNKELTLAILKYMNVGEERIEPVEDRLGHDFRYALDVSKIKKLGFEPKWSFEDALANTIKWYRDNEVWWKPLKRDKFTVK